MAIQVFPQQEQPDVSGASSAPCAAAAWWCFWLRGELDQVQFDFLEDSLTHMLEVAFDTSNRGERTEIFLSFESNWPEGYLRNSARDAQIGDIAKLWPKTVMAVRRKIITVGGFYAGETVWTLPGE